MANYDFSGLMEEEPTTTKSSGKYDFSGLMEEKVKPGKKLAWEISTPEELVGKGYPPWAASAIATGQQLSSPVYKYGNMLLGGLPDVALRRMGYQAPESDIRVGISRQGKNIAPLLNTMANIGGFVRGVPMRAGIAAAGAIPVRGIGGAALRGATQYGTAAGLTTPVEEAFNNWRARGARAGFAGLGGAAIGTIQGVVSHFTNLLNDKAQLATGASVRKGFSRFKGKLTKWFGEKLNKFQAAEPTKRVDINESLEGFRRLLDDNRKFKTLANNVPRLKKALASKFRGKLTLPQSQDLINQIKETVSDTNWAGKGVKPSTREVQAFVNSLKSARNAAFPQMKFTDATFSRMKDYTNSVENIMKFGKTVKGLKSMVSNAETKKALQAILDPSTYKRVVDTVTAGKLTKTGARAIYTLIRYGIIYGFMRKVFRNNSQESSETIKESI